MVNDKSKLKYRGAEVIGNRSACNAARALQKVRLLSAEVPRLPLTTCDQPSCKCVYRHFDDRRQGPRREGDSGSVAFAPKGIDRRRGLGRREAD